MQLFRHLANNIFFKILLAFVALTFVLFGVSGFILGSPNSWVVKIGGTTIGQNTFNNALQADREMILTSGKSEEALKYVESERFKSDVLGRLVNKVMIEKLNDEFGVTASKKLILEAVAKDPSFKNEDGKFSREKFKGFLAKNGLNEERYVNEISNDITATMIIQTLAMAAPINPNFVLETENFKQEKRRADVITISQKNVGSVAQPTANEIGEYYEANKQNYVVPEMRKVSYLSFSKSNFAKDLQISDQEVFDEYEKNKDQFTRAESRNLYHVVFEKEEDAKAFSQKLNDAAGTDKSKLKAEFAKLAKDTQKKDVKAISINGITQKDLLPQLADEIFKLNVDQTSPIVQSPLGYHVFLLLEIKKPQLIPFNEVKNGIKQKIAEGREEKVLQAKITEIDDMLLTSNSIADTAKKFNLKAGTPVVINQQGQTANGAEAAEIKGFEGFAENAFNLRKDQTSKILYAKNSAGFYAIKVEEITPSRERKLDEIKTQLIADLNKEKQQEALQLLARKIGDELKANPESASQIIAKYNLKVEKNREFPRIFYVNFQGRQMPYQNEFLNKLFTLKIGQSTGIFPGSPQDYVIGILRDIQKSTANPAQFDQARKQADDDFKSEMLQEYNAYLLKQNPVKVNEKILGKKAEK